jgi:hypothetical protein
MNRAQFLALATMVLAVSLLAPIGASAADADPLFSSNEVMKITIEGPLRALSRDRAEEAELRPGTLTYSDAEGVLSSLQVELQPRGQSRRDRAVCTFPPLWVHFDKQSTQDTVFAKQNRVKMVTYCRSPKNFQDYIVKEYLVYRIFNTLSDASFRVRLLEVTFQETDSKSKPLVRYGFFIEHKKRLAKRLDLKVQEPTDPIPRDSLEPGQASIAELFQYMVSNTDFSFIAPPVNDNCCHNAVLFGEDDQESPIYVPVPYDFDRTGLVNPPNGEPAEELGQRSFRDRVYRGFCRSPEYLEGAIAKTFEAREEIEVLIRDESALSQRAKDQALKYVASYYDVLNDSRRRERDLKCRAPR